LIFLLLILVRECFFVLFSFFAFFSYLMVVFWFFCYFYTLDERYLIFSLQGRLYNAIFLFISFDLDQ